VNWTNKIAGCFGTSDLIFAGHPKDEERAFELLAYLRQKDIGWVKAHAEFEAFLQSKQASGQHIVDQLAKLERFYRCWLLD
jgi:hypothetical protein